MATKKEAPAQHPEPQYAINKAELDSLLQEIYTCNWRAVTDAANKLREELQPE